MKNRSTWDRELWGVLFSSGRDEAPLLLGDRWWDHRVPDRYPDEPPRVLLWKTRKAAREWCKAKTNECKYLDRWRFVPVRVRETVVPVVKRGKR